MQADVSLLFLVQAACLDTGHHIFRAMKGFWDQSHQSLRALFTARQTIDIGIKSSFAAGNIQQLALGAHDLGEQDIGIVLPLVAVR